MKSRIRTWPLIGVVLLVAILFRASILGAVGAYLVQADPPQKADVALVLSGDGWGIAF